MAIVTYESTQTREPIRDAERRMTMQMDGFRRASRLVPAVLTAVLVLGACGSDDDGAAEQPPPTPVETSDEAPVTAPPTTAPLPDTVPPTTPPTTLPDDQRYEVIGTVIEESQEPRLCFEVMESLPPQCGDGVSLVDWSWDAITVEIAQNDTTWVDQIYISGTYDNTSQTFMVGEARLPTDEDRQRLLLSNPLPDFSVPCEPPEGGWPARTQEWPGEVIAALDGYAGAWIDEPQQVMTVKFTGDLDAAQAAVREHYTDALCVVGAEHDATELSSIQEQLHAMSSVQILWTMVHTDASGEWIEAGTIAPDPARQAAFDAEFGPGVVRLTSLLQPVTGA